MKNNFLSLTNAKVFSFVIFIFALTLIFSAAGIAQKRKPPVSAKTSVKKTAAPKIKNPSTAGAQSAPRLPKVTQIDAIALRNLLKRGGANAKPLLVNFWATWCEPCREEFPDLVKINDDYKDKIDFVTVSLDDLAEIKRDVPKFLDEFKAEMPTYLLKTADEEATIATVSKSWQGGLPFTILFDETGEIVYNRQGKIAPEILRGAIEKLLPVQAVK